MMYHASFFSNAVKMYKQITNVNCLMLNEFNYHRKCVNPHKSNRQEQITATTTITETTMASSPSVRESDENENH